MGTLEISIAGRNAPVFIRDYDHHVIEDKTDNDLTEKWLVVYRSKDESEEIGRYKLDELTGYHDY